MTQVKRGGYIVTASYGTVVLLNGLEIFSEYLDGVNLIIIEGLEPIPPESVLKTYFEPEIKFTSKEEYLSKTLSVEEMRDEFLVELILKKLSKVGSEYMVRPSSQTEYDYLSLYAGIDNLELLKEVIEFKKKFYACNWAKYDKIMDGNLIGMNYTQIEESDHLLMVTKPKMILDILLGK